MLTGHPTKGTAGVCLMQPLPNQTLVIPRETRLIKSEGPTEALSRANSSEKYIYIYISLKVSAMLPGKSEIQSLNDVRQREGC